MVNAVFPLSSGTTHSKVNFPYRATYRNGKTHMGVDLDADDRWISENGNPKVLAPIAGQVHRADQTAGGWGNYCVIRGDDGYYHIFGHLQGAAVVRTGEAVQAGQVLGILGNSGNSTGPHTHYEVRTNYSDAHTVMNPCSLLGIANTQGAIKATGGVQIVSSVGTGGAVIADGTPTVPPNVPYEEMTPIKGSDQQGDRLFGRRCRVLVADDTGVGIELTDLHVVFNVVKTYLQDLQYSIIKIYNVNRDTEAFVLRKGATVIIEAGYEGVNYGEIFQGDIIQAMGMRENGTDFVLKIVAADSDRFLNEGFISHNIKRGMTQRQGAESVASQATIPTTLNKISPELNKSTLPRGKVFFGLAKDYLAQIAKTSNATLYMNNGQINILKVTDPPDDRIFKLTPSSGLIGIPQQTELGIKAKALLIPQIQVNRSVQVESHYIEERQLAVGTLQTLLDSQGVYRIAKTTYMGDTRGNDWYVEFEAMTQAGYLPTLLQNSAGNPF